MLKKAARSWIRSPASSILSRQNLTSVFEPAGDPYITRGLLGDPAPAFPMATK
jgi:hypothetical protein